MPRRSASSLPPYRQSIAGSLLAAREAVMAPIRPHLRAANVTEQQWRVLRVLADADSLDARGIADAALLYAPTVSRILKELADRALIARHTDPDDGRRWVISITPKGRKLVTDTARYTRRLLDDYARAFGQDRIDAFRAEALALAQALARFAPGD